MSDEDGGAAHPERTDTLGGPIGGMSLRDYFAAAALQGILAGDHPVTHEGDCMSKIAIVAFAQADAMLTERSK